MLQIPWAQWSKLIKLCLKTQSEKSWFLKLHASDSRRAVIEINQVAYKMTRCENCMLQIPEAQWSKLIKLCVTSNSEKSRCLKLHVQTPEAQWSKSIKLCMRSKLIKLCIKLPSVKIACFRSQTRSDRNTYVKSKSEKPTCIKLHASDSRSAMIKNKQVVEINKVRHKMARCQNCMLQNW